MISFRPKISFDEFSVKSEEELDFSFISIAPETEIFDVLAYEHPDYVKSNNFDIIGTIKILHPISNSL